MQDLSSQQALRLASLASSNAGTLMSSMPPTVELAAGGVIAIGVIATGIALLIEERIQTVEHEREGVEKMIENHFSTYFIADEAKKRSHWDQYIHALVSELESKKDTNVSLIFAYAGIKAHHSEEKKGTFYSTHFSPPHPSELYFDQSNDEVDILLDARKSLHNFLCTDGFELLQLIDRKLNDSLSTQIQLTVNAESFLTRTNASRMLVLILMRIGHHLMYPMNPSTNMAVDWKSARDLCDYFRQLLSSMLADVQENLFKAHREHLCQHEELKFFISKLDNHCIQLRQAFDESLKRKLNLKSVTDSSFYLLQTVNRSVRSMVYLGKKNTDPIHLIALVTDLHTLIERHSLLVGPLVSQLKLDKKFNIAALGVNNPPKTVIDLLVLFSHVSAKDRQTALSKLQKKSSVDEQFHRYLTKFDQEFIQPFEEKLNTPKFLMSLHSSPHKSVAIMGFMASVGLAFEGTNDLLMTAVAQNNANQQIRKMNQEMLNDGAIYNWDYLNYLGLNGDIQRLLKSMLLALYALLPIAKQVHLIQTLVKNNEHFLLDPTFQQFLGRRLEDLDVKQQALVLAIKNLSQGCEVSQEEQSSNRELLAILSSLANNNPDTNCSISDISEKLTTKIQDAKKILFSAAFDEQVEQGELHILTLIESLEDGTAFLNMEERRIFFDGIYRGIVSKKLSNNGAFSLIR